MSPRSDLLIEDPFHPIFVFKYPLVLSLVEGNAIVLVEFCNFARKGSTWSLFFGHGSPLKPAGTTVVRRLSPRVGVNDVRDKPLKGRYEEGSSVGIVNVEGGTESGSGIAATYFCGGEREWLEGLKAQVLSS